MPNKVFELSISEVRQLLELLQGSPSAVSSLKLEPVVGKMKSFIMALREQSTSDCIVLSEN